MISTKKIKKTRPTVLPCLSVPQPNAWALFAGKKVQSQSYQIGYRGPLLIYAYGYFKPISLKIFSAKLSENGITTPELQSLPNKTIIGCVHLINCSWSEERSIWGEPAAYHWCFRESKLFENPVTPPEVCLDRLFYIPVSTVPEVPPYLLDYYLD